MNNKATTVCFSGHRVFQDPTADIEKKLDKAVRDCISKGAECFITGGALGFDTLAARTVIRLREEFPQIKLILALPCPPQAQTLKWSAPQVAEYREILGFLFYCKEKGHLSSKSVLNSLFRYGLRFLRHYNSFCNAGLRPYPLLSPDNGGEYY